MIEFSPSRLTCVVMLAIFPMLEALDIAMLAGLPGTLHDVLQRLGRLALHQPASGPQMLLQTWHQPAGLAPADWIQLRSWPTLSPTSLPASPTAMGVP